MKSIRLLFSSFLILVSSFAAAADLSITTTSFIASSSAKKEIGTAGAAITIGQLLYFDGTAGTWKLADANASASTALVGGIAGSAAASGQQVIVITEDTDLTVGATISMTAPIYVASATAGGIAPSADLTTGWYPSIVFVSKSTTKCIFKPTVLRGTAALAALFDLTPASRLAFVAPNAPFHLSCARRETTEVALAA